MHKLLTGTWGKNILGYKKADDILEDVYNFVPQVLK